MFPKILQMSYVDALPQIEGWLAARQLSTPSEEQILEVVKANYDSLTLKLQVKAMSVVVGFGFGLLQSDPSTVVPEAKTYPTE